jgi:hypothetical protein
MSSTMMVERTGAVMPGAGLPATGMPHYGAPTGPAPNWLMVPRCTYRFEKCQGGFKLYCSCDDRTACGVLQNLCAALAGGLVSCCMQYNGVTVCACNFFMATCRCETTEDGVCITCTSGDAKCGEMLQAYCDCLHCCYEAGCACCVMMSNTPVCCGCCEPSKTGTKSKR